MDDPMNANKYTNIVRMLVLMLSVFGTVCLVLRHKYKTEWKLKYFNDDFYIYAYYKYQDSLSNLNNQYTPETTSMFNSFFISELLMMLTCPLPFFDTYITMSA